MKLTIGQLKCASNFTKHVTSARGGQSHEIHCAAINRQTLKITITHLKVNFSFVITQC